LLDLVAGQLDIMITGPAIALPHVRNGAVKVYAVNHQGGEHQGRMNPPATPVAATGQLYQSDHVQADSGSVMAWTCPAIRSINAGVEPDRAHGPC
jgi:hypothetical protein